MASEVEQMMMTFQEVYAKLERVFCTELIHGGWCIFKTEKHIILEKSHHDALNASPDLSEDPLRDRCSLISRKEDVYDQVSGC